jgi:hypothetical protein
LVDISACLSFLHVLKNFALHLLLFQDIWGVNGMRTRGIISLDCILSELEVE